MQCSKAFFYSAPEKCRGKLWSRYSLRDTKSIRCGSYQHRFLPGKPCMRRSATSAATGNLSTLRSMRSPCVVRAVSRELMPSTTTFLSVQEHRSRQRTMLPHSNAGSKSCSCEPPKWRCSTKWETCCNAAPIHWKRALWSLDSAGSFLPTQSQECCFSSTQHPMWLRQLLRGAIRTSQSHRLLHQPAGRSVADGHIGVNQHQTESYALISCRRMLWLCFACL